LISAGASMVLKTAGGGGLGSPALRDPANIESDCRNGLVLKSGTTGEQD